MMGDMLSFDHLHIVRSQIRHSLLRIKVIRSFLVISAALSRPSNALRLKRCSPIGRNATQGRVENLFRGLWDSVPSHLIDAELNPFDSPSPNELLDYRSENPLDEATEIRGALAEAELNPWVEVRPDTDQMIQINNTVI